MNGRSNANLRELLGRFLDPEEARAAAQDIAAGEKILAKYPAPEPDPEVVGRLQSTVATMAHRRRRRIQEARYGAAVAAAVMILATVGVLQRYHGGSGGTVYASILPAAIWESEDIASDDPELIFFTAEIEQIEQQIEALESGEFHGNGDMALEELEMELAEMDTDFWKG